MAFDDLLGVGAIGPGIASAFGAPGDDPRPSREAFAAAREAELELFDQDERAAFRIEQRRRALARALARALRAPTTRLRDGTTGYHVRPGRIDDCWAAAVATCLQVPIESVPDPRLDERLAAGEEAEEINEAFWREFARWLAGFRLVIAACEELPVTKRRWIGVVEMPGLFNDHTLVFDRAELLFDPVGSAGSLIPTRSWSLDDVAQGFVFQRTAAHV